MTTHVKGMHHIGQVVKDIDIKLREYHKLGFEVDNTIYIDKEQKVKVGKVKIGGILIELLTPLDENSPIWNFCQKQKNSLHHICIKVDNIDAYLEYIKKNKIGFQLTNKTASVFEDKKICFIATHDHDIIELMEY